MTFKQFSLCVFLNSLAFPHFGLAGNKNLPITKGQVQVILSNDPLSTVQVEAHDALAQQILNEIAKQTGAKMHYSVLPDNPITATCVGSTVKQAIECVLGSQVGVISRVASDNQPQEIWILGSSAGSCPETVAHELAPAAVAQSTSASTTADSEYFKTLLEQAKAKDPAQRAEALANMGAGGAGNDPQVHEALISALSDSNANVRAQAIGSLAQLEGQEAYSEMQRALSDSNVSVRLAVVDHAGNNGELLQQALNDQDPSVRDYATGKLAELARRAALQQ